jgi:hypothetical protein
VEFLRVRLLGPDGLDSFYADFGELPLEFVEADGTPFYHFALLVPGDRFDAAFNWAQERFELLPDPDNGELVFDFSNWNALACYFHDPAGNIVELIAHRGVGERGTSGQFSGAELLGFSELGLVGDVRALAQDLEQLDLHLWDGTLDEPGRLAFVGEKARTLILCPEGRGWLPTGRPAEPHAVDAVLAGSGQREVDTGGHRIAVTG